MSLSARNPAQASRKSRLAVLLALVVFMAGIALTIAEGVRGHTEARFADDGTWDPRATVLPPLLGAPCPRTDFVGATLDPIVNPTGHNWTRVTLHINDLSHPCPGENDEKQLFVYSFRFKTGNPSCQETWIRLTLRANMTSEGRQFICWEEDGTATASCGGPGCFEISVENSTLSFRTIHGPPFQDASFVSEMATCHGASCSGGKPVAIYGDRMPDRGSRTFWGAS